jgi:replicative DNA helicase
MAATNLYAPEAERTILGALLKKNVLMPEAAASLRPQDFGSKRERLIYGHMIELWEAGGAIDELTLAHSMSQPGELQKSGGVAYLSELADSPRRASLAPYIEIVRERARRRELIRLCELTQQHASDLTQPLAESLESLREGVLAIESNSTKVVPQHVAQFTDQAINEWERLQNQPTELAGLTTGIGAIDKATTGIRPAELWVVGGAPGEGKSAIAITAALENARRDIPVAIFSVEMTRDQVLHRMWAQCGGISYARIRTPKWTGKEDSQRIKNAACEVGKMPIYIDGSSSLSIRELVARGRLLVQRHGVKLIVVDYIQLIRAQGQDERQRVSTISDSLRELAKEAAPVLALSQLARPKDRSLKLRPNKYWLKESGALEADAHVILLVFRPRDKHDQPNGADELIIAKQRNGPIGIEPVEFDEHLLRYRERCLG